MLAIFLLATPAFADIACVQRELTRIGLDPGPADGKLGRKTLAAAKSYQEGAPYLQDLSTITSRTWCDFLVKQPALVTFDPNTAVVGFGTVADPAMDTTPVLGRTPEYQVPGWVNNPH